MSRLRSPLSLRALLLPSLAAVALAAPGCIIIDDDDDDIVVPPDDPVVDAVGIDVGGELAADAGEGVGVFVEYLGGGDWRVWTTCDSELTGYACTFDLFASGSNLRLVEGEDLEGYDDVEVDPDLASIYLETDFDTDGVTFRLDDEAPMRLEVWLDGRADGSMVFWVWGGDILQGMPTNPTDFVP